MNDTLPETSPVWQYLESAFQRVAKSFGYREIRFPVLEHTRLFKRSIGEVTDIVEKEMYSFDDRNGDNLSLRPEGTAGCVRAAEQHGLLYNQQQRLWYQGPMFRHERPQKGRYRQFHQFGLEAFGMAGPDIDAEVLQLAAALWRELDLTAHLRLELNNVGGASERAAYSKALTGFLLSRQDALDEDAARRIHSNPMRVLDSKNPGVQAVLAEAPVLEDFIQDESRRHYQELKSLLAAADIAFVENPRLVRGLDYYNNCVYEWTTDVLGAQGAVCGGGRYDVLVEQLGGRPTPACGFAIGLERLVLMLETLEKIPADVLRPVDVYVAAVGEGLSAQALALAQAIRRSRPELGVVSHCGGGKFNSQIKRAFHSGARLAVILERQGDGPELPDTARIRRLDDTGATETCDIAAVPGKVAECLAAGPPDNSG